MSEDVVLQEMLLHEGSSQPDWRSKKDYLYIEGLVAQIESAEISIKLDKKQLYEVCLPHGDYVARHYKKTRKDIIEAGWRRGTPYPSWVPAHYIWKDCHMALAWEYVRRSPMYRRYYKMLIENLEYFLPSAIDILRIIEGVDDGLLKDINNVIRLFDGNLAYFAWRSYVDCRINERITHDIRNNANISHLQTLRRDVERRIRDISTIDYESSVANPSNIVPPIFLSPANTPRIVGVKSSFSGTLEYTEGEFFDRWAPGVLVAIRTDQDIDQQFILLRHALEERKIIYGNVGENAQFYEIRPQRRKYIEHIRVLDAIADGQNISKYTAEMLYPRRNISLKNLEKVANSAKILRDDYYFRLATIKFK
ncbi:hypothetical protein [Nitrospirillum sp. BR 11828]|uniref:hypothetical protein n=1 Tax=Nitrospirillum sp. BR 11828 TaxID=3104325 RepID=UPI002ACACDEF|nr:hypothetical protein [Nitrospirillum sp. BR 11828]MDZ5646971.1 hypothetical protein [Nitrospirillum sp. BR 11828]